MHFNELQHSIRIFCLNYYFLNLFVSLAKLDLASTNSIREFVKEFTRKKKKLSVLINNAAIALNPKDLTPRSTKDGYELTMATNHLGSFNQFSAYLVSPC